MTVVSVTLNALLAQLGRGASLRRKRFRVRISGGARSEAGKRDGSGRYVPRGAPVAACRSWRVNRPGCRAPLLTDARIAPWRSSRPLSSEGDETTR